MFIMVFQIRGAINFLSRVSWDNSRVLRLRLLRDQICSYHNPSSKTHSDSESDALSYLNVLKPVVIRKESTVENSVDKNMKPKDYRMFYKFPHIAACGFLNKSKKHFTVVMAIGVPAAWILRLMDIISSDAFYLFISQGGVISWILYSVGMISYKLVGSIYLSSDMSTVKISYLDFWGKRVDVCCPLSDVVPLSDMSEKYSDVYVCLRRYSTRKSLHFTPRFGVVLDTKLFTYVFGSTEE